MNIKGMVESYLEANGYDGLAGPDCGCEIGDLMPCDVGCEMISTECYAGYKVPCPGPEECYADGECEFHIEPRKDNHENPAS